jgi:hypothetical protein
MEREECTSIFGGYNDDLMCAGLGTQGVVASKASGRQQAKLREGRGNEMASRCAPPVTSRSRHAAKGVSVVEEYSRQSAPMAVLTHARLQ